ncbi:hypothetical protein [Methylobacterium aquaticum]|uniref:hypothetical protein n=1 Tax=Methylobacterium aquaticum TaxID=270351 RepID=UPI000B2D2E80|nr:hypothetical protein [Methylobacterium aquaticum]
MLQNAKRRNVCLVTNEIYPFAPGGIGRLISNWIIQNKEFDRVNLHLLLPKELNSRASEIIEYCAKHNVVAHFCEPKCLTNTEFGVLLNQSQHTNWDYLQAYYTSYMYFAKLKEIESQEVIFDVIEFPDYGGWGAVSIEAKRSGIAFHETQIAVRLHSTFGIIVKHEEFYHQSSGWHAGLVDLERLSLDHADIIIGHIKEIARENMEFYRLSDQWFRQVIIETPPIYVDNDIEYEEYINYHTDVRFVFSSRFQPFKRPDLFIKASCLYFEQEGEGEALLISYGWDKSYVAWLESLIPPSLREKIRILTNLSPDERRQMLVGATVVIPSDYESYCLFAYESAMQGNRVLLRRSCSAFGRHEAWVDGENCLMFGDSPEDLALVMKQSVAWQPTTNLITQPDVPYWNDLPDVIRHVTCGIFPKLHLLICDVEDHQALERCRQVLKEQEFDTATVLCSSSFINQAGALQAELSNVRVIASSYGRLQMDEIYDILVKISEDVAVIFFATDMPNRYFCQAAKDIFKKNPSISVITSHDMIIDNNGIKSIQFSAGEQSSCILAGMPVVGRLVAVRRDVLMHHNYEYASYSYGWQAFFQSLLQKQIQICVIPDTLNYTNFSSNASNINIYYPTQLNRSLNSSRVFVSTYGLRLDRADFTDRYRNIIVHDVTPTTPIVRVHPEKQEWWGEQVSFNNQEKYWLIHPMESDIVVARLHLDRNLGSADAFFIDIRNSGENSGVLMNVIAAGPGRAPASIVGWVKQADRRSQPIFIRSGETRRIFCSKDDLILTSDLYIVSRVPPGYSSQNCWAMLVSYGGLYL